MIPNIKDYSWYSLVTHGTVPSVILNKVTVIDGGNRYKRQGFVIATSYSFTQNMEFTTTQRGAHSLIYQGYKYVINQRGRDGRTVWRCGKSRSCSGVVTTLDDAVISTRDTHNHPADAYGSQQTRYG